MGLQEEQAHEAADTVWRAGFRWIPPDSAGFRRIPVGQQPRPGSCVSAPSSGARTSTRARPPRREGVPPSPAVALQLASILS